MMNDESTVQSQRDPAAWKQIVAKYQKPCVRRAVWQVVNTLVPYVGLWVLMYFCMSISWWLTVPLAVLAAFIVFVVRTRLGPHSGATDELPAATASLLALHIGALIYLGTFAAANNFDYRLVFLLLVLPQLTTRPRPVNCPNRAERMKLIAQSTVTGNIAPSSWANSAGPCVSSSIAASRPPCT